MKSFWKVYRLIYFNYFSQFSNSLVYMKRVKKLDTFIEFGEVCYSLLSFKAHFTATNKFVKVALFKEPNFNNLNETKNFLCNI